MSHIDEEGSQGWVYHCEGITNSQLLPLQSSAIKKNKSKSTEVKKAKTVFDHSLLTTPPKVRSG